MGKVQIDHTGSGGGITLSSDGTSLLVGGSAVGGADLYAANDVSATAPTASGNNAVAIGDSATAAGVRSTALTYSHAGGVDSFAAGIGSSSSGRGAQAGQAVAIGNNAYVQATEAIGLGYYATIGSSGTRAVALGHSYANGNDSFAAVIDNNTSSYGATSNYAIALGQNAKAASTETIAMGVASQATANAAVAIGGGYSEATAQRGMALGSYAKAATIGKFAFSNQRFAAAGDSQGGLFILRADTTDATATVLTTNNSTAAATNQIVAASDTCITFDGTITAMQNGAQAYASFRIEGLLVNDGGTTTLANSATTVIDNQSSWVMALSADNTNNALAITCTGEASHNIRWVANIRTTEVTYA